MTLHPRLDLRHEEDAQTVIVDGYRPPSDQAVTRFYDRFSSRLLGDFVRGNPRIEAAIKHAIQSIGDASRILDIGCGIGWSTHEIKRAFPSATVQGVDLSPKMIEIASRLFGDSSLLFRVEDLRCWQGELQPKYDAIVLLDVYEHISQSDRPIVHRLFGDLLSANGSIILTCPSVRHQDFLRQYEPTGLQPIDEDISLETVEQLAKDINGRVEFFAEKDIWKSGDYVHAVVRRGTKTNTVSRKQTSLEAKVRRSERVVARTGRHLVGLDTLVREGRGPKVCITTYSLDAVSETFIRSHLEQLPFPIRVLHGPEFQYTGDGCSLWPQSFAGRGSLEFLSKARLLNRKRFQRSRIARYLKNNDVAAVLCEFATNSADILEACRSVDVPMIVHFHGYDAYRATTIKENRAYYRELFSFADAIVAVSHPMVAQLVSLGADVGKVHCIPCGVDCNAFSGASPSNAAQHFVAVGRFIEKKAPHLTLLAFAQVAQRLPEAHLTMIGDGPLYDATLELVHALKLEDRVRLLGSCKHEQIVETLLSTRAFVQHSVTAPDGDSEGTPVAILEAQAAGLPVISTRHAGIPDVVLDKETGFLVDEFDIQGMAQRMMELAEDPNLAGSMGEAGRARAIQYYRLELSIDRLSDLICRVAKRNLQRIP